MSAVREGMSHLRVVWKWFLIFCAVGIGTALLNLWRPTVGLGDVVFFMVAALWIARGMIKDALDHLPKVGR